MSRQQPPPSTITEAPYKSTPAVWTGRIFVGTRAGRFFAIGDR